MLEQNWPNFLIVGAAKAGTTSLYTYLSQHPQVFMSHVKEPHYFSQLKPLPENAIYERIIHTEEDYLKLFKGANGFRAIGEASPSYLYCKGTPGRIKEKIPNARILVILRDPIDRAYSHYLADVAANRQTLPFYDALQEDYINSDKGYLVSHLYIELGMYSDQLFSYMDTFGEGQVLILMFDSLKNQAKQVLEKIAVFLNLDPEPVAHIDIGAVHNQFKAKTKLLEYLTGMGRLHKIIRRCFPLTIRSNIRDRFFMKSGSKPSIDPKAKIFLEEIFEKEYKTLEEKLGICFGSEKVYKL